MEAVVVVAENMAKTETAEPQAETEMQGGLQEEDEFHEESEEPMMPTEGIPIHQQQKMFRKRNPWPESKIAKLLDGYINEYLMYMRARKERQIREFHTYIGQTVGVSGSNAANLVKNLGREYRKLKQRNHDGGLDGTMKLRGSMELFNKYEHYCLMYNPMGSSERRTVARKIMSRGGSRGQARGRSWGGMGSTKQLSDSLGDMQTPRVKKRRQTLPSQVPFPISSGWNSVPQQQSSSSETARPPTAVMTDKYSAEYVCALREQTQVLTDIAKELRLLRMGYFIEHDLSMEV